MKKSIAVSILLGALALLPLSSWAQRAHPTQAFMREKLTYAQGILEGITLAKFNLVLTNATPLRNMNQTNAFVIVGNLEYRQRTTNFFTAVDALIAAAKARDLNGSTEAYLHVAKACVECHETFRREQFVQSQLKK